MSLVLSANYQSELFRLDLQYAQGLKKSQINSLFPPYPFFPPFLFSKFQPLSLLPPPPFLFFDFQSYQGPTTLSKIDVRKMGRFSHQFEPLPPPRFASPVRASPRREREENQESAFKQGLTSLLPPSFPPFCVIRIFLLVILSSSFIFSYTSSSNIS